MSLSSKIKWTSERDYELLSSMKGYRPIGLEKHFHMMFILERFRSKNGLNVTADALWDRLYELYDIKTLDDKESELFLRKPTDYSLPPEFKP